MVLDDLHALPDSPLLLAEGSTISAHAVSNGLADRSRAVWLIPTPEFQQSLLAARGTPPGPTALYLLLRDMIAREASEHGVPTLILDGSLDLEATVAAVEARPARRAGPIVRLPQFCSSWADEGGPSTGSESARRTPT
jgi:hypothetical protein